MLKNLLSNWPLKLLSVFLAFCIWFVIISLADPSDSRTVYNVPVKLLHEDLLSQAGKSYTVEEGEEPMVDVKVSGKGSLIRELNASDFTATADIEEMIDINGAVPIRVTCSHPSISDSQISLSSASVTIKYESIVSKTFTVTLEYPDAPPEGYFVGSATLSPRRVQVTAPSSVLDKIGSVVAEVDVSQMTESTQVEAVLQFFTNTGEELRLQDYKDTRVGSASSMVNVEIQTMKTLRVEFTKDAVDDMKSQVPEGYRYTGYKPLPEIQVKGLKSRLADWATLTIPAGKVDLRQVTEDTSFALDLISILPEGIELMEGQDSILQVTIEVDELVTREFTVRGVRLIGEENGFRYEFDPKVTVKIRGLEDDFPGFDPSTISLTVDLSDYAREPGKYYLPVEVHCEAEEIFQPLAGPRLEVTVKAEEPPTRERSTTAPATEPVTAPADETLPAEPEKDAGEDMP